MICVKINTGEGIEVRIAEYNVALGSSQPEVGVVRFENLGRTEQMGNILQHLVQKSNASAPAAVDSKRIHNDCPLRLSVRISPYEGNLHLSL